jgi:hypothetical protein
MSSAILIRRIIIDPIKRGLIPYFERIRRVILLMVNNKRVDIILDVRLDNVIYLELKKW